MLTNLGDIFFRLFIFFLFTLSLYKLIRDILLPILYQQISEIKQCRRELKEKNNLLNSTHQTLKKEIEDQKEIFIELDKKVHIWHTNSCLENKKKEEEYKLLYNKIKEKRKIQMHNLDLLKTEQAVIPQAICKARKRLKELYSDQKGLNLLKTLIIKIEPENASRS
ncbi:hypothetical protein K9L05_02945 [Candidatus Babeliales bacterium]|nr:hypothetical protein [Candidatus Babeliales bacterium]MCF7899580.1 hypothetical protein [Candidatus Babeliales bacterium]